MALKGNRRPMRDVYQGIRQGIRRKAGWQTREQTVKLRIKGNSLRLRLTRPEMQRFVEAGRVEEAIYFGPEEAARLTYAIEHCAQPDGLRVRFTAGEVVVVLSTEEARRWAESEQVGVYGSVSLGQRGLLKIAVEKDFVCLDRDDPENADAFPNPRAEAGCAP